MAIVRRAPTLHIAADSGGGQVVVLLHGIASSSVTFQNVVPLIGDGHRVIAIDLLGFGGSPIPEEAEYTVEEHVASVERTISSLRLRKPFVLVGHSMGALIATRYASHNSKRVQKLVLVSPPIYLAPAELSGIVDRSMMDLHLRVYQYMRLNKRFTLRAARGIQRLLPNRRLLDLTELNWTPFVKSLEHSIESQTTISDLAAVDAPVDLIYGTMDQFHSAAVLRIVARMTGITVHRVVGSDHLIGKRLARVVATAIG